MYKSDSVCIAKRPFLRVVASMPTFNIAIYSINIFC